MTIVLASIADAGDSIVMTSDRMLASAELSYQFEHDSVKIRSIGRYLVGYAGATALADDILSHEYQARESMHEFIKDLSKFYIDYGNGIITRVLLESIGIDLQTFNANPQSFPGSVQEKVYAKLAEEDKLPVQFIVCGYDKDKPRIYLVGDFGIYGTAHSVGYAAIGVGQPHASNFYMVNGFKFNTPLREAIYFAFRAKKSAEMAAGVGKRTDICILRKNEEPLFFRDGCTLVAQLNKVYSAHEKRQGTLYERTILPELNKLQLEVSNETS